MHILIIEDEVDVRNALARTMRLNGHTVSLAETVHEACAKLADERFDVVLTDRDVGGENAWEFASTSVPEGTRIVRMTGAVLDPSKEPPFFRKGSDPTAKLLAMIKA